MKCAAVETEDKYKEQQVQILKKETGFDEIVIGCFMSNYKKRHVCPIATGNWCRDYIKCKCMEESIERKIKEQQAHNEAIANEKEGTVKTVFLMILVGVFATLDIVLVGYLLSLIFWWL